MSDKSLKRMRTLGNMTLQVRVSMEEVTWIKEVIFAMQHDEQGKPGQRVMTVGEIVEMALKSFRQTPTGLALSNLTKERLEVIKRLQEQGLYEH